MKQVKAELPQRKGLQQQAQQDSENTEQQGGKPHEHIKEEVNCGGRVEVVEAKEHEEREDDAFDVLPNELLSNILLLLHPVGRVVCKSVCYRWYQILTRLGPFSCDGFAATVACEGHLNVLRWARSQGCPWNEETCAKAAWGGHLEVLQWLRSQGCPWNAWTYAFAVLGGHLEVFQWVRSQGCLWDDYTHAYATIEALLKVL